MVRRSGVERGLTRQDFLRVGMGTGAALLLAGCGVQGGTGGGGGGGGADYPTRPVELIVPFAPGGSTDLIARAVAREIEEPLGQTMVAVNREGAGGAVGTKEVAEGAADGYRLTFSPTSLFTIAPIFLGPEDTVPLDELKIVTGLTQENIVLLANANGPYQTLDDVLALADSGEEISFGHSGRGIGTFLAQTLFYAQAGIKATDVPFDGGGPSVTALLGQQVDMGASQIAESAEQVAAGDLIQLGIFSAERSEFLPDVPTMKEQGFDLQVDQVRFIAGPKDLPDDITTKLADAFKEATQAESYGQFLEENFIGRFEKSGDEVRQKIETDLERYRSKVEELGIETGGGA